MIGYLDCSTGVSGDKFLGALLDVGEADGTFTADDLQAIVAALAGSEGDRRARQIPWHRSRGSAR